MKSFKYLLIHLMLLLSSYAFATVDYLAVNHLTKQLYWADADNSPGLIGWTNIPEGKLEYNGIEYLNDGFTFTNNPYLIEELILIAVGLIIITQRIRKRLLL